MFSKRITQITLSMVTLLNVGMPRSAWAENLPVKSSPANASVEDLKTPEIDFEALNRDFANKLKELQSQAVKLKDQKIVAPDYKKAQAVFREQLAEGVQYYLNDLAVIKKETEKVLKKSFSRIKAIKEASDAAKVGETIDDNALRMTLDSEKRSLLDAMKKLQEQNNIRYSSALLNLRNFKAGGLGVSPFILMKEYETDSNGRPYDSYYSSYGSPRYVAFRGIIDKNQLKLDCFLTIAVTPSPTKKNIVEKYYLWNQACQSERDLQIAPIRLSKKVKAGEWTYDNGLYSYSGQRSIPNWILPGSDQDPIRTRFSASPSGQGKELRFNLNPIAFCDSQFCVNMLMKDITDWQEYVDTLPQEINMEKVLENVQGQAKIDGTLMISNTKDKVKRPFIFESLLSFAKKAFSKPVLTPNTATSLPAAGGKVLEKSANMFGGVVAGIAAAPVAVLEGTIGSLALAISNALDIEVAELSLDISNNYPYTNGSYLIDLSKYYAKGYVKTQNLPTILVDKSSEDQDEE